MLTILESLNLSTEFLEKKGVESSRLNAELLLAEILGCNRLDLYLRFDKPLSEDETVKYREWIVRRGKFEPLQYIIGKVEFAGMEFSVDPSVLIPRPETEILVETVLNETDKNSPLSILDIGTGSGIISVCLGKSISGATITAVDVSPDAVKTAEKNAKAHQVEDQINFVVADIKNGKEKLGGMQFDVIVSNPPYVSEVDYGGLQNEIVMYEPKNALTDYSDGLDYYRIISNFASVILKEKGKLFFEIGKDQLPQIMEIMSGSGFSSVKSVKDYAGIERVVYGEKS